MQVWKLIHSSTADQSDANGVLCVKLHNTNEQTNMLYNVLQDYWRLVRWWWDQQRTRHGQVVHVEQHFVLHESWLAKNGGRSRRANSLWHVLVFVRVVEFDTMLSTINMFRRLSYDKPRNALKFLVKRRHVFNTLISYFKRGDHITDSGSGCCTPTIRTCCNIWRATNAAYLLTYFRGLLLFRL